MLCLHSTCPRHPSGSSCPEFVATPIGWTVMNKEEEEEGVVTAAVSLPLLAKMSMTLSPCVRHASSPKMKAAAEQVEAYGSLLHCKLESFRL